MKNSTQYTKNIKQLFTSLKKDAAKHKTPTYQDPIEAIVFAALCQDSTESAAKGALKKIQQHFVDFNDLRVARAEEICEVIGEDIEFSEKCAATVTSLLNAVFQKYDCLDLTEFLEGGKKEIKESLEKLKGMTDFICGYFMLTFVKGHAVPLTAKMIEYLKTYGLAEPDCQNEQIISFIERQITAANAYAFYALVRHDSELANPKAGQIFNKVKSKTTTSKKAKPKK